MLHLCRCIRIVVSLPGDITWPSVAATQTARQAAPLSRREVTPMASLVVEVLALMVALLALVIANRALRPRKRRGR